MSMFPKMLLILFYRDARWNVSMCHRGGQRLANFAHLKAADSNQFQQVVGIKTHTHTYTHTHTHTDLWFPDLPIFQKIQIQIFSLKSSMSVAHLHCSNTRYVTLSKLFYKSVSSSIKCQWYKWHTNSERQTKTFTGFHFNVCSTLPQVSSWIYKTVNMYKYILLD